MEGTGLVLIRKADGKRPERITKAKVDAVNDVLSKTRVARPELVEFVLSGEFHEMTAIPQPIIDNPQRRLIEHPDDGWIIPETCLGRAPKNGERDWQSTRESVRLWMKSVFVATGVLRMTEIAIGIEDIDYPEE